MTYIWKRVKGRSFGCTLPYVRAQLYTQPELLAHSPASIFVEVEVRAKQHWERGVERQEPGIHAARKLLKAWFRQYVFSLQYVITFYLFGLSQLFLKFIIFRKKIPVGWKTVKQIKCLIKSTCLPKFAPIAISFMDYIFICSCTF